ncbi:hypothetical protein [Moritella viscosa]|uniref:TadG-like protein n=1 Tax=Moritella viscosa TaxID=80854 RepID=A0A1L0BBN2_9GAMM|nr:hypothetical protein [Moritella viscosa]SGY99708.1 TadG-like protein [Moritella viscosa]
MKNQQGVAMIIFVIIAPILMTTFFIGLQGARALQNKSRIEDAVDMANMAVISQKSTEKQAAKALADEYMRTYMTGENNSIKVNVEKLGCYDSAACRKDSANGKSIYIESKLSAVSNHDYWFKNPFSDESSYDVAAASTSRKFQGKPADVYFIADMSGSMTSPFKAKRNGKSKFEVLAGVIKRVTADLEIYNSRHTYKHRVALTGYNYYTYHRATNGAIYEARQYNQNNINIRYVVDNMLKVKPLGRQSSGSYGYFYDMLLTSEFKTFNDQIALFRPRGVTASDQGIMRAAQIADRAVDLNDNQVFIILSDGNDTYPWVTRDLVQAGMCSKIKKLFNNKKSLHGEDITVTFAVIGIDYNVKSFPAMSTCVGPDNVYHASSDEDVYKNIINLISEESGRLVTH